MLDWWVCGVVMGYEGEFFVNNVRIDVDVVVFDFSWIFCYFFVI